MDLERVLVMILEKRRNNATRLSFARNHVLACIYDMTKFVDIHVLIWHAFVVCGYIYDVVKLINCFLL